MRNRQHRGHPIIRLTSTIKYNDESSYILLNTLDTDLYSRLDIGALNTKEIDSGDIFATN